MTFCIHENSTSFIIFLLLIQKYHVKWISLLKNISLNVSFYAKAESAMSRISDVVNKIMQISGEMDNFRFLQFL